MKPRLEHLLERELQGALTAVEREELGRLLAATPGAAAEAAAWRRVESGLVRLVESSPAIDLGRVQAAIAARRREAASHAASRRAYAALGLALLALVVALARELERPRVPAVPAAPERPPVEVHLGPSAIAATEPISIRF